MIIVNEKNKQVPHEWFTWDWKDDITFYILPCVSIVLKFELRAQIYVTLDAWRYYW